MRLYAANKPDVAKGFAERLDRVADIQKYTRIAFSRDAELAVRFAQTAGEDLEYSPAEIKRMETIEKEMQRDRKRPSSTVISESGPSNKYSKVDRTHSTCKSCKQKGHWAYDRDENGIYICSMLKPKTESK